MGKTKILPGALLVFLLIVSSACNKPQAAGVSPAASSTPAAPTPAAPVSYNPEDSMPRISVEEAKAAIAKGEAVMVDVRGPDAYKMMHIKGAIEHSLGRMEANDFKGLPKNKRIIAYCSCPTEHSSARAAYLLKQGGFNDVGALVGGNAAWEAAGGEMVKAP